MGKKFKCKSEEQKRAIKASYARKAEREKKQIVKKTDQFPKKFPFWARFKPNKNRPTLVIDEEKVKRKNSDIIDDCFVHRESIHGSDKNRKYIESKDYEEIYPNPDPNDPDPMYLKRPQKDLKNKFSLIGKNFNMPENLKKRYEGNNNKK
ncbi:MAG: hypothetical protein K2L70_04545 [Clostridia bacterium]|nr:hypothetical protein [Clostridia bacterium]